MARIIIFNETTGEILRDLPSGNTPEYEGRSDALINPDDSALVKVEKKYWIVELSDKTLREMTKVEKDVVDLREAQEQARSEAEEASFKGQQIVQFLNAKMLEVSGKTDAQKANFVKSISDVILLLQAGQLKAAKVVLQGLASDVDRDGEILAKIKEYIAREIV